MNKDSICRVCESGLRFVKHVRGEESGSAVSLYKCNYCQSFFSCIESSCQAKSDVSQGPVDHYIENEKYLRNRVGSVFSYISQIAGLQRNAEKNFLDIGCGAGWSLVVAKQNGYSAYGVEPVTEASKYANETLKLNVINSLFKPDLFPQKNFDFIMMDQVLEHIPNPKEVLVDAFSLLKPGGTFFLAVPAVDWSRMLLSISFQLSSSTLRWIKKNRYLGKLTDLLGRYDLFGFPEGHINYFSPKAVSLLAENCNAKVLGQYHAQKIRAICFPFFKLSTGSFFLRKN